MNHADLSPATDPSPAAAGALRARRAARSGGRAGPNSSLTDRSGSAQFALAMAEIDAEVVERVSRWCAEAGRQAQSGEIRRALSSLTWDELLVAKALLADPPPARPLGPYALADLARGAPADVAAEREREGRYAREEDAGEDGEPAAAAPSDAVPSPPAKGRRRKGAAPRGPAVVIRRARDRIAEAQPAAPALPSLDELRRPEGRSVLERLVRRHGGRRVELVAALAAGWRTAGGASPADGDLTALLEHHGLARAFEHRERDECLHALRAAGGVRAAAAARLGIDPAAFDAALERLGATGEAERIRERARRALRARGTLSERVRLLLVDEDRLRDLGILGELEDDLRARLPEHVRALQGAGPLAASLAGSLSVTVEQGAALVARFGLVEGPPPRAGAAVGSGARGRPRGKPAGAGLGRPRGGAPPAVRGRPPKGVGRPAGGRPPRAGGGRPSSQGGKRSPRRPGGPAQRGPRR